MKKNVHNDKSQDAVLEDMLRELCVRTAGKEQLPKVRAKIMISKAVVKKNKILMLDVERNSREGTMAGMCSMSVIGFACDTRKKEIYKVIALQGTLLGYLLDQLSPQKFGLRGPHIRTKDKV